MKKSASPLAKANTMNLGERQKSVLRSLISHGVWPGGWYWQSTSVTVQILDSLVKRGLVDHKTSDVPVHPLHPHILRHPYGIYMINDEGRKAVS